MRIFRFGPTLLIVGVVSLASLAPCRAGEKSSLDWQVPKLGAIKETPIVFVSPKKPAEWNALKGFWNPGTDDTAGNKDVKRPVVRVKLPLGLSEPPPVPIENAMTTQRWELGRKLYFDPVLSADLTVSCATCHNPKQGFTDQLPVSSGIGGKKGGVSAPTVINSAYNFLQFWDGRAISLEDQAQGPVGNDVEMFDGNGHAWNACVTRLRKDTDYVKMFLEAYGTEPTRDAAAKAIATYERTVLSGNSIHDRAEQIMKVRVAEEETGNYTMKANDYERAIADAFVRGDRTALDALKLAPSKDAGDVLKAATAINDGRALFFGKARCSLCHVGQNLSDSQFHNLGVGVKDGKLPADGLGRFDRVPTGHKNIEHMGAFKTPPLRSLVSTGPYMHNGSEKTLEEVIDFYDRGGNANEFLSPKMRDLDAEKAYLLAKSAGKAVEGGREVKLFGETPIVPMTLRLTPQEKAALVMFLRSLEGEVDAVVSDPKAAPAWR